MASALGYCRMSTHRLNLMLHLTLVAGPSSQSIKVKSPHQVMYVRFNRILPVLTHLIAWRTCLHRVHRQHSRIFFFSGNVNIPLNVHSSLISVKQWTGYFCSFIESDYSWRVPLFIQCIIGAILAAGSLLMPESPRFVQSFLLIRRIA